MLFCCALLKKREEAGEEERDGRCNWCWRRGELIAARRLPVGGGAVL